MRSPLIHRSVDLDDAASTQGNDPHSRRATHLPEPTCGPLGAASELPPAPELGQPRRPDGTAGVSGPGPCVVRSA
jgi:hypothetical protein